MKPMHAQPLYQRLAEYYRNAIQSGALPPAARMPSARAMVCTHHVSLSTALQVCRRLEDDGLVEARPRSGYFVRRATAPRPVCVAHGAALIEDDTYGALADGGPHRAIKHWDRAGDVIYCSSLHKTLAPGMRLGWIMGGR